MGRSEGREELGPFYCSYEYVSWLMCDFEFAYEKAHKAAHAKSMKTQGRLLVKYLE